MLGQGIPLVNNCKHGELCHYGGRRALQLYIPLDSWLEASSGSEDKVNPTFYQRTQEALVDCLTS